MGAGVDFGLAKFGFELCHFRVLISPVPALRFLLRVIRFLVYLCPRTGPSKRICRRWYLYTPRSFHALEHCAGADINGNTAARSMPLATCSARFTVFEPTPCSLATISAVLPVYPLWILRYFPPSPRIALLPRGGFHRPGSDMMLFCDYLPCCISAVLQLGAILQVPFHRVLIRASTALCSASETNGRISPVCFFACWFPIGAPIDCYLASCSSCNSFSLCKKNSGREPCRPAAAISLALCV